MFFIISGVEDPLHAKSHHYQILVTVTQCIKCKRVNNLMVVEITTQNNQYSGVAPFLYFPPPQINNIQIR